MTDGLLPADCTEEEQELIMPETKLCNRCGQHKPNAQFYRDRRKRDGLQSLCKECKKIKDRLWGQTDSGKASKKTSRAKYKKSKHGKAVIHYYILSERGKARCYEANRKYLSNPKVRERILLAARERRLAYPRANRARNTLYRAVANGTVRVPTACCGCGRIARLCAHHEDYEKPLAVTWLCGSCHRLVHNKLREAV